MAKTITSLCIALLLSACIVVDDRRPNGPVIKSGGGPPPWAPAHGRRAKEIYRYYYYPSVGVYLNVSTGTYFYLDGGTWQVSTRLPSAIVLDSGESVSLELDTDKPYIYYEEHRGKFKGKKLKKEGKGPKHGRFDF